MAPLTQLTSSLNIQMDHWGRFSILCLFYSMSRCVSAPILKPPIPSEQFIVEVDTSDTGVGVVLSQRLSSDNKIHPCLYLSWWINLPNKTMMWKIMRYLPLNWHWQSGDTGWFIIWTDHKTLSFLQNTKRLNLRQGCWSLFFVRFNFVDLQATIQEC